MMLLGCDNCHHGVPQASDSFNFFYYYNALHWPWWLWYPTECLTTFGLHPKMQCHKAFWDMTKPIKWATCWSYLEAESHSVTQNVLQFLGCNPKNQVATPSAHSNHEVLGHQLLCVGQIWKKSNPKWQGDILRMSRPHFPHPNSLNSGSQTI